MNPGWQILLALVFQFFVVEHIWANLIFGDCRQCNSKDECSDPKHQICLNRCCRTRPDFHCDGNQCQFRDCARDPEKCSRWEPNRKCITSLWNLYGSQCLCLDVEDPYTGSCRQRCQTNIDCQIEDPNSHCNVYFCRCNTDFRRNETTGKCEPFQCETDRECWSEGDQYRNCRNGTCMCDFDLDETNQQCTVRFWSIFKLRYYRRPGQAEKILLLTIIIVPFVLYYCIAQNFRKARSTLISLNQQQQFPSLRPAKVADIVGQKEVQYQAMGVEKQKSHSLMERHESGNPRKFKYERFK